MNWKRILSETVLAALHACTSALEAEIRREAGEPEPEPAGAPPPPEPPPASANEPEPTTPEIARGTAEPPPEPPPASAKEPEPTTPETAGLLAAAEPPPPERPFRRIRRISSSRLELPAGGEPEPMTPETAEPPPPEPSVSGGGPEPMTPETRAAIERIKALLAGPIARPVLDHLNSAQLPLLWCFARAVRKGYRGELRGRARELIAWLEEKGIVGREQFKSNDLPLLAQRTPLVSRTVKAKDGTWIWSVRLDWFETPPPDVLAALHACKPASQIHKQPPGAAH